MTQRIQKTLSFDQNEIESLNYLSAKFDLSASAIVRALVKQAKKKVDNRLDLENCITAHNVQSVNLPVQEIYQWMVDYFEHKIKNFKVTWQRDHNKIHKEITEKLADLFWEYIAEVKIY